MNYGELTREQCRSLAWQLRYERDHSDEPPEDLSDEDLQASSTKNFEDFRDAAARLIKAGWAYQDAIEFVVDLYWAAAGAFGA